MLNNQIYIFFHAATKSRVSKRLGLIDFLSSGTPYMDNEEALLPFASKEK